MDLFRFRPAVPMDQREFSREQVLDLESDNTEQGKLTTPAPLGIPKVPPIDYRPSVPEIVIRKFIDGMVQQEILELAL